MAAAVRGSPLVTAKLDEAFRAAGLPPFERRDVPTSTLRFPDGAAFRIEIPSTEGPEALEAVLEEADRLDVPVRRVSQGSGVDMLTDADLDPMAAIAADAGIEVSLFARPGADWGPSASARAAGGGALAPASWGHDQLRTGVDDVLRAAEHGFRSVLIADLGLLAVFGRLKVVDDLGGFVRLHEVAELVRVAAPIHVWRHRSTWSSGSGTRPPSTLRAYICRRLRSRRYANACAARAW